MIFLKNKTGEGFLCLFQFLLLLATPKFHPCLSPFLVCVHLWQEVVVDLN